MSKLIPCGERLLIEKIEHKKTEEKKGLIVMPDQTKKESLISGAIIAVGNGEAVSIFKEGDIVIFNKHSGDEYTHEDKKYIVIEAKDILLKKGN